MLRQPQPLCPSASLTLPSGRESSFRLVRCFRIYENAIAVMGIGRLYTAVHPTDSLLWSLARHSGVPAGRKFCPRCRRVPRSLQCAHDSASCLFDSSLLRISSPHALSGLKHRSCLFVPNHVAHKLDLHTDTQSSFASVGCAEVSAISPPVRPEKTKRQEQMAAYATPAQLLRRARACDRWVCEFVCCLRSWSTMRASTRSSWRCWTCSAQLKARAFLGK